MPSPTPRARAKPSGADLDAAMDAIMSSSKPNAARVSPSFAAALAGISVQAIHRAIMRGTLKADRQQLPGVSRAWIAVDAHSLREYIKRNRR